jgi:membrane protein YdbS with pleckstrin-like domain
MNIILKPSQWINFGWVLFGVVGFPLIIPTIIAIYKIVDVYCWSYTFRDDYLVEKRGVFTVSHTEVHYHRIKSVYYEEPFLMRLVGLSKIFVSTSDRFAPFMTIVAIPDGDLFVGCLKEEIRDAQRKRGIKEIDLYNL